MSGTDFTGSQNPFSIASGDVNNDGKLDVVTANYNTTGSITVFLGTGTGDFTDIRNYSVGSLPRFIALKDFNGDGNLDAVVLNQLDGEVKVLLGNGTGSFSALTQYSLYNPAYLEISDINNDGKLDLVVIAGDFYVGKVYVYLGIGNGTFGNPVITNLPDGSSAKIAVEDFNQDGKKDFAYSTTSKVSIWFGDGTGNFALGWSSNQGGSYTATVAGELNGDNKMDLTVYDRDFNYVQTFFNSGNGTFQTGGRYTIGEVSGDLKIADLNRDGLNDIITANFASNEVSILLASGNGQFAQVNNQTVSGEPRSLVIGDFNGDGKPDIVTTSQRNSAITLTLGKGDGTLLAPTNKKIFTDSFTNSAAVADINSDGRDDFVTANSSGWGISVFLRTGAYKFAPARSFLQSTYVNFAAIADFNRDGKLDIVAVGGNIGTMLLGDGSGNFTVLGTFSVGTEGGFAVFVGSADFNGDGKLDIVVSNRDHTRVSIFPGNGDGTFAASSATYLLGGRPGRIAIGDFNNDGKPDLAIALDTFLNLNGSVQIRLNQGDGTFPVATDYSVGQSIHPTSVVTSDFNGDGKLDFAVTVLSDPTTAWQMRVYFGDGNGTFSFSAQYAVQGTNPSDLVARDFNSDGKIDIATINNLSEDVSVFTNSGSGLFLLVQKLSAGEQPRMIVAGNFNNDGSPDLIATNYNVGTFTIAPNGCNQASESSLTKYDFDGDGKADVSVFRLSNGAWYLNQSANGFTGLQFGVSTDKLVPADYDGDGKTDVAVYRSGIWYLQRSQLGFTGIAFGDANDIPQPADFDGDGKAEIAVFRPSNGTWYILNLANNQFNAVQFGQNGDKPVVADYDGDGKADYAVYRSGTWYMLRSQFGFTGVQFGDSADRPVPADYDGDGKADIAVFRPSNGVWYLQRSQAGFTGVAFGLGTDLPTPADYDGDGRADVSVFRDGNWYRLNSANGAFYAEQFGAATDKPISSAFVP